MEEQQPEQITLSEKAERMCTKVLQELEAVHSGEPYDIERAKRTAALALQAQMEMARFLSDLEVRSKNSKSSINRVEAEAAFAYKTKTKVIAGVDKLTDAMLKHCIAADSDVLAEYTSVLEAEGEYKKWLYLFNSLKDAHIFFRNLGNGKNDWSL